MKEPVFREAVVRLENTIRRLQMNDYSGHDWWHTWRVRNLATYSAIALENADKIVVLERGNIVEIGKHDELLAKNGVYASLYNVQFKA